MEDRLATLEDLPRPGRPTTVDDDKLLELVEDDPTLTTRMLGHELNISHSTVQRHLARLGFSSKLGEWVPHELTTKNKQDRVKIFSELIKRNKESPFLDRVITGDEKWVLYVNPHRHAEWVRKGDHARATPKAGLHPQKVMLCVWWDKAGPIHWELLADGVSYWWDSRGREHEEALMIRDRNGNTVKTLTAELYAHQLERVHTALLASRSWAKTNPPILLHDNARPHIARLVKVKLGEIGFQTLPHPPYSPTEAPSDYHLFRSLSNKLEGEKFHDLSKLAAFLRRFFAEKPANFYARGIELLPLKWKKAVEYGGEYPPAHEPAAWDAMTD
jgi:histone-lysine N-methyltransferase SETMAR